MNRILISLILALAFIMPAEAFSFVAESTVISMAKKPTRKDLPTKGHRMPSEKVVCVIDFTSGQIMVETSSPVISYELRDEEGETMIVGFSSDSDLVEFMTSLQGVYQIRLVTDEYLYIGYIEL